MLIAVFHGRLLSWVAPFASRSPKAGDDSLPECGAAFWEGLPPGHPESRSDERLWARVAARTLHGRDAERRTKRGRHKEPQTSRAQLALRGSRVSCLVGKHGAGMASKRNTT